MPCPDGDAGGGSGQWRRCDLPTALRVSAEGGAPSAGDATPCPLGFACVEADGKQCGACAFVSCDMGVYDADSATLTGVDGSTFRLLLGGEPGDQSGYDGGTVARIHCNLSDGAAYVGCPQAGPPVRARLAAARARPVSSTQQYSKRGMARPSRAAARIGRLRSGHSSSAPSYRTMSCRPEPLTPAQPWRRA